MLCLFDRIRIDAESTAVGGNETTETSKINGDAGERVETPRLYTHICLLSHKWLYNIRDQTVFGDIFQFCISFVNLYDFMFMNMMVK